MVQAAFNPYAGVPAQQPSLPAAPQQPASSPEEAEQRKAGWMQFFDQIDNDPNIRNTLIQFGAQMMQPIAPGDSSAAALSRGVANSMSYLNNLRAGQAQGELEAAKTMADIEATRTGARKTAAEAEVVKPKAEAAINLNISQAENLKQATESSKAKLPGEVAKTEAETQAIKSGILNDQLKLQLQGRGLDIQEFSATADLWSKIEAAEATDQEIAQGWRKLSLMAEELEQQYAVGKLPAADIQKLEWYAANVTGGDKKKAAEMMVREDISKALAGNIAATEDDIAQSISDNALQASGFTEPPPIPEGMEAAAVKKYGQGTTVQPQSDGTFAVIKDGKVVDTIRLKQ